MQVKEAIVHKPDILILSSGEHIIIFQLRWVQGKYFPESHMSWQSKNGDSQILFKHLLKMQVYHSGLLSVTCKRKPR